MEIELNQTVHKTLYSHFQRVYFNEVLRNWWQSNGDSLTRANLPNSLSPAVNYFFSLSLGTICGDYKSALYCKPTAEFWWFLPLQAPFHNTKVLQSRLFSWRETPTPSLFLLPISFMGFSLQWFGTRRKKGFLSPLHSITDTGYRTL